MSLTTRCPACQTLFQVVPDQLRISGGWVRCGRCDEIFDASLHLLSADLQEATPEPIEVEAATDSIDEEAPITAAAELASEPELQSEPELFSVTALPELPTEPTAQLSDVSFMRDSTSRSFWRRPLARVILIFLSLGLLLSLSGQIVFYERDRIAASEPGLKPWLLKFCGVFNCTVSPLRNIEAITIDSSSFVKLREDAYSLNFTLKNTAATALALPAIELTLTDSLDQAIVRRVFLAPELGFKLATLAAGFEWPASLALAVTSTDLPRPVAGYRLIAFYP